MGSLNSGKNLAVIAFSTLIWFLIMSLDSSLVMFVLNFLGVAMLTKNTHVKPTAVTCSQNKVKQFILSMEVHKDRFC